MSGRKQSHEAVVDASRQLSASLREARVRAGVTQEQLARKAGLALSTVRKIEANEITEPGVFTVIRLCHALGMPLDVLAELSVSP